MITISLLLLVAAFAAFVIAAFGVATARVNLIALGLALWALWQGRCKSSSHCRAIG